MALFVEYVGGGCTCLIVCLNSTCPYKTGRVYIPPFQKKILLEGKMKKKFDNMDIWHEIYTGYTLMIKLIVVKVESKMITNKQLDKAINITQVLCSCTACNPPRSS
jgi:hypothetical protein